MPPRSRRKSVFSAAAVGFSTEDDDAADANNTTLTSAMTLPTDASKCIVAGEGLHEATSRKLNMFSIEARDATGAPQHSGGDVFLVSIRGRGETVRAKVLDNERGTYFVGYKPVVSGKYYINVSLRGFQLPGSPFTCFVTTPTPSAAHCILRGQALTMATARKEESFEVQFCDSMQQVAHAEDLDVYVTPLSPRGRDGSPRRRATGASSSPPSSPPAPPVAPAPADTSASAEHDIASRFLPLLRENSLTGVSSSSGGGGGRAASLAALAASSSSSECLVTSRRPLTLRATSALDSDKVGQVYPGQRLILLEVSAVQHAASGERSVRARVALADDIGAAAEEGAKPDPGADWRDYASHRPRFLDGVSTPRSPHSARSSCGHHTARASSPSTPASSARGSRHASPRARRSASASASPRVRPDHPFDQSAGRFGGSGSSAASDAAAIAAASGASSGSGAASPFLRSSGGGGGGGGGEQQPSFAELLGVGRHVSRPAEGVTSGTSGAVASGGMAGARANSPPTRSRDGASSRGSAAGTGGASASSPGGVGSAPLSIGWLTLARGSKEFATPRGSLSAGERQQHMAQWARRLAVDRSLSVLGHDGLEKLKGKDGAKPMGGAAPLKTAKKLRGLDLVPIRGGQSVYHNELAADEKRIGFAFGGVVPGRLHAHGQLIETHKVHYSIAMCGDYSLHVALRHDGTELPGSPFMLRVQAGPASAVSTRLAAEDLPLWGVVGDIDGNEDAPASGCRVVLHCADKMGNPCSSGGANVGVSCPKWEHDVVCSAQDLGDGSYALIMRSCRSGTYDIHVLIDNVPIVNSPTTLKLTAEPPALSQSEVTGSALSQAVAGRPSVLNIVCKDRFDNPAHPDERLSFELALLSTAEDDAKGIKKDKDKLKEHAERWKAAPAHPFEGAWKDQTFEMNYVANVAGNLELYVWACYADNPSERIAMPGSPFAIHCQAGPAHAGGSSVDKFTRILVDPDARAGVKGPALPGNQRPTQVPRRNAEREARSTYEESYDVFAGDPIQVRPRIRDKLGNPTAAPEGKLSVMLEPPDGAPHVELRPTITLRNGLTNYEVKHEPSVKGKYHMHVSLAGAPIAGSPVFFEVVPSLPDVSKCRYELPTEPILYAGKTYTITLFAVDKCGNDLDHGGAIVTGRLQSANLPSQQEVNLEVEDQDDGSYVLSMNLRAASELKVILSIDKERQGGAEFQPIPMVFVSDGQGASRIKKVAEAVKAENKAAKPVVKAEEIFEMAVNEFQAKGAERAAREGGKGAAAADDGGGGAAGAKGGTKAKGRAAAASSSTSALKGNSSTSSNASSGGEAKSGDAVAPKKGVSFGGSTLKS